MPNDKKHFWIVCQIGARENYSVARALARQNRLEALITDLWCPPDVPFSSFLGRLGERSHLDIPRHKVWAPTGRAILRELADGRFGRSGWQQIMHRNAWFQGLAIQRLKDLNVDGPVTLFAYSYAAKNILTFAKARGWKTVLGQIDPGPVEARMVDQLYRAAGQAEVNTSIPAEYWEGWRQETELADAIVVNSEWSRKGLLAEGVSADKITVLPLAYETKLAAVDWSPPKSFDEARKLRLLFLGQVTLRKGIDLALEAMRRLPDLPLQLDVVGAVKIVIPDWVKTDPRIQFHGDVPRSAVANFYAQADMFLFPTRSDGFGLTQLEALSAGVPVIASNNCGEVVINGQNGFILPEFSAERLADLLQNLAGSPQRVAELRREARLDARFDINTLGKNLIECSYQLHREI